MITKRDNINGVVGIIFGFILIMAVAACSHSGDDSDHIVVVNTEAQKWIVNQIAGEVLYVAVLIPSGRDAETYEPDIQTMRMLSEAQIYLTTATEGFESRMLEHVAANLPEIKVTDVSSGISPVTGTHAGRESKDPHLLSSVRNVRIISRNVFVALSEVYPEKSAVFRDNYASLDKRLDKLDQDIDSIVKGKGVNAFVTTHPVLSYFARDYGLRQIALERDGKEPSPRQLSERMEEAVESGAGTLYYEKGHADGQALEMARRLGVKGVPVYFEDKDFLKGISDVAKSM